MDIHENLTKSTENQQTLGFNESKNFVRDKATQTLNETSEFDYCLYFSNKRNKTIEDNDEDEQQCSIISIADQERIKEYAVVNEAKNSVRNARAEYIEHLQNFAKKIDAFDKKYNNSRVKTTANLWKNALAAMKYEKRRSKSIKYDSHLQVRLEIGALRKAREDYEAWICKFDEQSKKCICCPCCRESLEDFIRYK